MILNLFNKWHCGFLQTMMIMEDKIHFHLLIHMFLSNATKINEEDLTEDKQRAIDSLYNYFIKKCSSPCY